MNLPVNTAQSLNFGHPFYVREFSANATVNEITEFFDGALPRREGIGHDCPPSKIEFLDNGIGDVLGQG